MLSDNIVMRNAQAGDDAAVLELYRSVIGTPFCVWNDVYPGEFEIKNDMAAGTLYVLTEAEAIIGAISIVPENELDQLDCWQAQIGKHAEIGRVVVSPRRQGQGLAAHMVRSTESILRAQGYSDIRLSVVKNHIPAQRTYEKLGFLRVGEADMYGHSYYLMEKQL